MFYETYQNMKYPNSISGRHCPQCPGSECMGDTFLECLADTLFLIPTDGEVLVEGISIQVREAH